MDSMVAPKLVLNKWSINERLVEPPNVTPRCAH